MPRSDGRDGAGCLGQNYVPSQNSHTRISVIRNRLDMTQTTARVSSRNVSAERRIVRPRSRGLFLVMWTLDRTSSHLLGKVRFCTSGFDGSAGVPENSGMARSHRDKYLGVRV